jgi:hypothetical protein
MSTKALGSLIMEQLEYRVEEEEGRDDSFYRLDGSEGPTDLIVREKPKLPTRWRYVEAHASRDGFTHFKYTYDEPIGEKDFNANYLIDYQIRDEEWGVPIFVIVFVYAAYHGRKKWRNSGKVAWKDLEKVLVQTADPLSKTAIDIFYTFVRRAFLHQQDDHPYFGQIVDTRTFGQNPLGDFLSRNTAMDKFLDTDSLYAFEDESPGGKLDVPRLTVGDDRRIYIGNAPICAFCQKEGAEARCSNSEHSHVYYCGQSCANQHWSIHQQACTLEE